MFALLFAPLLALAATPVAAAACPASDARVVSTAALTPPDNIHPTNRRARFLLDLGSDGRIRRAALVESSGDAAFDAAALATVQKFRFAPPTQGCISTSFTVPESFDVPLLSLVQQPAAGSSALPTLPSAGPAGANAICVAPFVQLTGLSV